MSNQRQERIDRRLDVVRGLLRVAELGPGVMEIALQARSRAAAVQALTSPPYSLSEAAAQHLLDRPIAAFTRDRLIELREVEAALLRGEIPESGPGEIFTIVDAREQG